MKYATDADMLNCLLPCLTCMHTAACASHSLLVVYLHTHPSTQPQRHSTTPNQPTIQAHYTEVLMRDMAAVPFPPERIHSTTLSGEPKASVLARLAKEHPGADTYIFVEDKLSTLEKVGRGGGGCDVMVAETVGGFGRVRFSRQNVVSCVPAFKMNAAAYLCCIPCPILLLCSQHNQVAADPQTANWQLYLVDWGYNTMPERTAAAANPKITVINVDGFKRLLHAS